MTASLLCAVDDTPLSVETTAVAADLARRLDVRLVLAQVVKEPPGFPFADPFDHRAGAREAARGR